MKSDVLTVTKFVDIHHHEVTAHRKLAKADIGAQLWYITTLLLITILQHLSLTNQHWQAHAYSNMQCVLYITAKPKSLAHSPQHLVYMPHYLCKIRSISVGKDRVMLQSVTRRTLTTEVQTVPMRVEVDAGKNHRDPAVRKGVRDPKIFQVFVFL